MGIKMTREWVATLDARTRHEHGAADGQRVGVDEPFTVGGEKLMFPGDTSHGASGWNIYNCRCTVAASIKGHERKRETYQEWLDKKVEEAPEDTALQFKKVDHASADKKQWKEYRAIVGDAVPKSFDKFQELKYNKNELWRQIKTRKKQTEFVNNAPCETTQKNSLNISLNPEQNTPTIFLMSAILRMTYYNCVMTLQGNLIWRKLLKSEKKIMVRKFSTYT